MIEKEFSKDTKDIMYLLGEYGEPYIVGSSAVFSVLNIDKETKDIDILLDTEYDVNVIKNKLSELTSDIKINSMGGIKLNYKGVEYDLWRAKDSNIYEEPYNSEVEINTGEDVIKNFGYNLYQVGIKKDGEIYCTKDFIQYALHKELVLVNDNIRNYKRLTEKAIKNDILVRRYVNKGILEYD